MRMGPQAAEARGVDLLVARLAREGHDDRRCRPGAYTLEHVTGVPRSLETISSQDPTVGLCLLLYGGPREGG